MLLTAALVVGGLVLFYFLGIALIGIERKQVLLDVLALDGSGKPVLDLTADELDVRIAGKTQPLDAFEPPRRPAPGWCGRHHRP